MSLVGLLLRLVVATRRTLAGWVAYAAILTTLYVTPGPLDELYTATAVALVAVTTWIVLATFVLDRSTTSMLAAAAGGPLRLHVLQTVAGAVLATPLAVVAVVGGRLIAGPLPDRPVVAAGVGAHLVAVLVGAGIGAVASRPVVRDHAASLVVAVAGFVWVAVAPVSSPLAPAVDNLAAAGSVWRAVAWVGAALVWAGVLTVAAGLVAARRRAYGVGAPT